MSSDSEPARFHWVYNNRQVWGVSFLCPGCGEFHYLPFHGGPPIWSWNEMVAAPSVTPSVKNLFMGHVCHFFLRDGQLEFCSDSTHSLAGKTVEVPESKF